MTDLLRYYGVDLRDLWRGRPGITPRYLLWLAEHFPEDSATVASLRGGKEHRPWTLDAHLLTALVNMTFSANRQRAGKPTRKPLVKPPVGKSKNRGGRKVNIAKMASARRVAGR